MKKFNFKINNFYSIFGQMPDGKKNIDSFLDEKIQLSLSQNVSSGFTDELMKRVVIEKEFAREDKKTDRLFKYIVTGFISMLALISIAFGFILSLNDNSKDTGYFNSGVDRFSNFVEYISLQITENLGFTFDLQSGVIILLIMLCFSLYAVADKLVFKKNV